MTKQVWGRCTDTNECGWLTPVADQPDTFITGLTFVNGVLTAERSDGASFPVNITIPDAETEQNNINADVDPVIDIAAETITFTTIDDVSGDAGELVVDLSALFAALTSAPFPALIAGDNITITGNAVDGYTFNSTDPTVDTDTFGSVVTDADGNNIFTFPDGSTTIIGAHTEVTDGGSNLVDNSDPNNVVIRPFRRGCNSQIIDVIDPNDDILDAGSDLASFAADNGRVLIDDAGLAAIFAWTAADVGATANVGTNGDGSTAVATCTGAKTGIIQVSSNTLTNDDRDGCDWIVEGRNYYMPSAKLYWNNRWSLGFVSGPASTAAWAGAPFVIFDERTSEHATRLDRAGGTVNRLLNQRLPFGASIVSDEHVELTVNNYATGAAAQQLAVENPRFVYTVHRRGRL